MTVAGGANSGAGEAPMPRPHVRPWALAAPVLILLIALPLLRPLRHPVDVSRQENRVLASVQARVEKQQNWMTTPDELRGVESMPVFSLLLCGPYWILRKLGLDLEKAPLIT